jgi:hypothetical protein
MLPLTWKVPAGRKTDTGLSLYTDKPFFQLLNVSLPVDYWYTDTKCIVGIDPPAAEWWKVEWPAP